MKIHILTEGGVPRSSELISQTEYGSQVFNSSTNIDYKTDDDLVNQVSNTQFLGRELTTNEKKCLLAHNALIKSFKDEWNVVLEDDAIVETERLADFMKKLILVRIKKPTIILLYIGVHGVFLKKKARGMRGISAHKCLALPSGAVGYAINSAGTRFVQSQNSLVGTADWPTWSRHITFYGVFPAIVKHDFSLPSIAQIGAPDSSDAYWPEERFLFSKMIKGLFNSSQYKAYGGVIGYIQINVMTAIFRRISHYLKPFFIRT